MPSKAKPDLVVLAQLHAALDNVVDTQEFLTAISDAGCSPPAVKRLQELFSESRELLRGLLTPRRAALAAAPAE
jgi:hypothetical protein